MHISPVEHPPDLVDGYSTLWFCRYPVVDHGVCDTNTATFHPMYAHSNGFIVPPVLHWLCMVSTDYAIVDQVRLVLQEHGDCTAEDILAHVEHTTSAEVGSCLRQLVEFGEIECTSTSETTVYVGTDDLIDPTPPVAYRDPQTTNRIISEVSQ